ncbi:zinc-dependent alcohol dehydrogenase family protein, partial [Beijerinckia sp. L45]|uniref:zinc-dependent alcohol dehydrogenase family protein n=1 Tax=Beijerinckia sp. L45 TaxID=1641855 RepID=UPI00131B65F2
MHAIHLTAYGDPATGLKHVEIPEPNGPGPGEVLIQVGFSPIIPSDLLLARGMYAVRPPLPSVIGNEGAGVVVTRGDGVEGVAVGDAVLLPRGTFAWAQRVVAPAGGLVVLPRGIDAQQASMLSINPPTAALLLDEHVGLRPGDWIALNAGGSGVGRALVAMARTRGLRTISIVRRQASVAEIEALGADVVVVDSDDAPTRIAAAVGGAPVRLGLDGVCGGGTATLGRILTEGGTIVTYGTMSGEPGRIDPFDLIAKRLLLKGFFMYYPDFASKLPAAIAEGVALAADGAI